MRTITDQSDHDGLVYRTATLLQARGYGGVCADVVGYDSPAKISWHRTGEGHVPDLTGGPYVIEVETETSLDLDHTKSQCALFSAFAREHNRIFVVVVPVGYKVQMQLQLVFWGIAATVWEL
jgi:hypothetical protein